MYIHAAKIGYAQINERIHGCITGQMHACMCLVLCTATANKRQQQQKS